MTTLIETIKADQVAARKSRDGIRASLLTTLIGEASAIGKNDGNREVTDTEVVALMKKFVKGIDESIAAIKDVSNDDGSANRYVNLLKEKSVLEHYMPKQLDELQLNSIVAGLISEVGNNMGKVMAALKERYAGQYDGKLASTIIKARI